VDGVYEHYFLLKAVLIDWKSTRLAALLICLCVHARLDSEYESAYPNTFPKTNQPHNRMSDELHAKRIEVFPDRPMVLDRSSSYLASIEKGSGPL
jgi:hypothetical protein